MSLHISWTLEKVIEAMPPEGQARVADPSAELHAEVEAAGRTLELRVTLAGKGVMHLTGIGELGG